MGEMTAEERDELRKGLKAAGYPLLARVCGFGLTTGDELQELQFLLRQEERLRVMEAGVRAAGRLRWSYRRPHGSGHVGPNEAARRKLEDNDTLDAALKLLETEVPDGQG